MITRAVQISARRQQAVLGSLAGLVIALLSAGATIVFVSRLASGIHFPPVGVIVGSAALMALTAWFLLSPRIERTLLVFLLYLYLLDGFLRLITGWGPLTVLRDVLLYSVAIGVVLRAALAGQRFRIPPLGGLVLAFVALVFIQVLNPGSVASVRGLGALRPHLEWVPLFFLAYLVLRTRERLRVFVFAIVGVAVVNAIVGLVQSRLSTGQLSAWGPGYADRLSGVGVSPRVFYDAAGFTHPRPFALGADSGFGGVLAMVAIPSALSLVLDARRLLPRLLAVAALGALVVGLLASQSRTSIVGAVFGTAAFFAITTRAHRLIPTIAVLAAIGVMVTIVGTKTYSALPQGSSARYETIAPQRIFNSAVAYRQSNVELLPQYAWDFPLGTGLGQAGPASVFTRGQASELDAESEVTFLLIELGVPGLVLLLWLSAKTIGRAIIRIRRMPTQQAHLVGALAAPLVAILSVWLATPALVSGAGPPFFWAATGALAFWLFNQGPTAGKQR